MRISLLAALVLATCAMGFLPRSWAAFKVVEAPKPAEVEPEPAPRPGYRALDGSAGAADDEEQAPRSHGFGLVAVTYVGRPPAHIEERKGMGRDVRLADALQQIAPPGWRGFGRADVADLFDPDRRVSWKGGRPWTDVLDILANEQDLAIEVDWQRKHLYVGKRQYETPPVPVVAKPAPAPARQLWTAEVGSTVRSTFEAWAKRAGWTVVWPMEDLDYRIVARLSFDGSIVDAAGKLTRLFEAAERPIAVSIHTGQRVLVFSEKAATL